MTTTPAAELLRLLAELRLHHLGDHLDDLIARWTKSRLGPREIIDEIAHLETAERRRRSVERRLKEARIGTYKPIADFDWRWPTEIDRAHIERLLALDFLAARDNAILAGAQGLGKTLIAQNIAHAAVLAGFSTLFTTASAMLLDLSQRDGARALQSAIHRYVSPKLLVIDEVGYMSYDTRMADLLFEIVTRRYEHGSIVMTTNLSFDEWPKHFPGAACVTALIDRLTHHAEIIGIEGKSYRLKEAEERKPMRAPRR